ncbi:tyrosine-type recombinase/integrase [Nitrosomonas ureae]|uniref:Integrase n=1 Tax=Nitrosomonas ureae TaxID=44577 RepID=A0A286A3S0_9PROT|nr:tyrosine-type recombinase/integrase [Nitrosomonas ureae]SOD16563.1 Integrase [Nitrosomonas ureae]
MAKIKLTNGRIAKFTCQDGNDQSFIWCDEVPGLGIRATARSVRKKYIFQSKIKGRSARLTIGDVNVWSIPDAQKEARRLQIIIDQGNDPRTVKADEEAKRIAETEAIKKRKNLETVTFGIAWQEYLIARKPYWGERHFGDHLDSMQQGGKQRTRSSKLTQPGALASLINIRLIDLTPDLISEWAKYECKKRPGRTRLAARLLSVFLSWCAESQTYQQIIKFNPTKNKSFRENLGKPQKKNDVLQREQLAPWFEAVRAIKNSIISAYLQVLLLTGSRPNELIAIQWSDIDFQWNSVSIKDKMEGLRIIPLTPYVSSLLSNLPRRNEYVFSSLESSCGHLKDPHPANYRVCESIGFDVTLHGLRRSFATLCEWIETPSGIAAQIQGHKPQGVREKHYIHRPLDLLRVWHVKIETWILGQAGIDFSPTITALHRVK